MPQQFLPINSEDQEMNRLQTNLRAALDPISRDALLNRTMTQGTVGTGNTVFLHSLGRTPSGWLVVDQTGNSQIWRTAWDSGTITLRASVAVNVKIFVF